MVSLDTVRKTTISGEITPDIIRKEVKLVSQLMGINLQNLVMSKVLVNFDNAELFPHHALSGNVKMILKTQLPYLQPAFLNTSENKISLVIIKRTDLMHCTTGRI